MASDARMGQIFEYIERGQELESEISRCEGSTMKPRNSEELRGNWKDTRREKVHRTKSYHELNDCSTKLRGVHLLQDQKRSQ